MKFLLQKRKFVIPLPTQNSNGLVVQLVRIHACHAWGRGFESRPDRKKSLVVLFCVIFVFTQV